MWLPLAYTSGASIWSAPAAAGVWLASDVPSCWPVVRAEV